MRDTSRARERRIQTARVRRELITYFAKRDAGPVWGRASRIRMRLRGDIRPSLRTVQTVLRDLFGTTHSLTQ